MNPSQHLSVVPAAIDSGASRARPGMPRDILLTVIVVGILLMVALGGVLTPEPAAPVAEPQAAAPQPSQEFVYFPSQYVNQGTGIPDSTPTF